MQYCSDCLGDETLRAEWREDVLIIIHEGNETRVPLDAGEGDRDFTIRALNDVLQPDYAIRMLVCSHGGNTVGFTALPTADWQSLESELSQAIDDNFVKLAQLPNIFTEMSEEHLPEAARARFQRMLERNRNS